MDRTVEPGALWRAAREAWPGVEVALEEFAAWLALHEGATHASDLYLACACARGDAEALRRFEEEVLPRVGGALRRLDPSAAFADEVRQILRQRLFVTGEDGGEARIASYGGRGPLVGWVRVVALRTAINLRGSGREEPTADAQLAALAPPVSDPALDGIKARFAEELGAALSRACAGLEQRDRTILRLRYGDDLDIDQIGAIYGVHRATVARWIARIRSDLFAATRRQLATRIDLSDSDFGSLLALAHSQLDLSLSGMLGGAGMD